MGSVERWRVEDLARRSDVSVDTIRFYQKRRLVPPPEREGRIAWYGREHAERLARIRALQRQGFSLAVIRRLLSGELDAADEPLAAAVARADRDNHAGEEELLTVEELAERSGVPPALPRGRRARGPARPRTRDGEPVFTSADVEIVGAGLRLLEAGLPLADLLALARRHHQATRAIAEEAVAMFDEHVRRPLRSSGRPPEERAEQLVGAFRVMLPSVTALVSHHFRRVLLQVAQEHLESVGEPAELAAVDAASRDPEAGWPA
ncbi:MAG: MerR family transcriptional regulator [Acidimicrobiia bacterium]|nr:MerR family transcriptional regulator [Acidimicrobiia bacterium]